MNFVYDNKKERTMIDNLTITVHNCTYNFEGWKFERNNKYSETYHLHSKLNEDGTQDTRAFFLEITRLYRKTSQLIITGSIRKWFFGKYSTNDLNKEQFEDSIKQIAKRLNIDYNLFLQGTIKDCEVGLNILTSLEPRIINTHLKKKEHALVDLNGEMKTGGSARNAKSSAGKEVEKFLKEYTSSVKIQKILDKNLNSRIEGLYAD